MHVYGRVRLAPFVDVDKIKQICSIISQSLLYHDDVDIKEYSHGVGTLVGTQPILLL